MEQRESSLVQRGDKKDSKLPGILLTSLDVTAFSLPYHNNGEPTTFPSKHQ